MAVELAWARVLVPAEREAVLALACEAEAADGSAPLSEQALNAVSGAVAGRHLLAREGGALVGYANILPGAPAAVEALVAPGARGRGVGRRLVGEALDGAGPAAQVWAHGDLPAARAVARHLGLVVGRELWQMRRSLDTPPLPGVRLPDGVVLRGYAGAADDAELLRVNNAAFSWHPEQGGWGPAELAVRTGADWFDPAGLLLAVDAAAGRLLGFHWTKVHADGAEPVGEVFVLAVDPAAQGGGLGRALTLAGLRHLKVRGLRTVLLYVEADNTAAVRTYSVLGFTHVHSDVAFARV